MVVRGCGCPLMRLSMDAIVLAGRGCPARFSVARFQWMLLSLGAVFRGAVVHGCGCPWARFSVARLSIDAVVRRRGFPQALFSAGVVFRFPFRSPPHLSLFYTFLFTPLYLTTLEY